MHGEARQPRRRVETRAHRPVPEAIGWETTLACNLRCRHCGSNAGPARKDELDTVEALSLCRQIIDLGVPRVCLSGGETLMRKDWRRIVDTLIDGGVEVGLLTNGWPLVGRTLEALAEYAGLPLYVSVSLDGTAAVHDHLRVLEGSFERATQGAADLKEAGLPVAVITTVGHANLDCLSALREYLFGTLKPYCWQLQTANLFGRAADHRDDCRLSPLEYARAVCFTADTRRLAEGTGTEVYAGDCMGYLSSLEPSLRDEPWSGCQAGLETLGIQSNGDLKGCLSIFDDRFIEGNALRDGIEAVWNKPGAFSYNRAFRAAWLHGTCKSCPVGEQCRGGCTAAAVSARGGPHDAPHCLRAVEAAAQAPPRRRAKQRRNPPRREARL